MLTTHTDLTHTDIVRGGALTGDLNTRLFWTRIKQIERIILHTDLTRIFYTRIFWTRIIRIERIILHTDFALFFICTRIARILFAAGRSLGGLEHEIRRRPAERREVITEFNVFLSKTCLAICGWVVRPQAVPPMVCRLVLSRVGTIDQFDFHAFYQILCRNLRYKSWI